MRWETTSIATADDDGLYALVASTGTRVLLTEEEYYALRDGMPRPPAPLPTVDDAIRTLMEAARKQGVTIAINVEPAPR